MAIYHTTNTRRCMLGRSKKLVNYKRSMLQGPQPEGRSQTRGALRVLSSSCHCSRGKGELGRGEKLRWICTSKCLKCWWIFRHPSCFFSQKKSPQVWKANNSRGIQFSNYPPANKAVQRSCLSPRSAISKISRHTFPQIFLRQEPQQWKKGRQPVSLMLYSKRDFSPRLDEKVTFP